jgi:type II secretory pathway pseudopilin PulG
MKRKRKQEKIRGNSGFSFIELILYISILTIMMGGLTTYALNIIGSAEKSSTQQELSSAGRYISSRLDYEIRRTQLINTGTSNFGVNLASNPANQISLQGAAPDNPVIINVNASGQVLVKLGAAAAKAINSTDTKVTNLTFTNNTSVDGKTKNITYQLTVQQAATTTRQEFTGTVSLRSSVELRAN